MFTFVIDTDKYAGNFERQMCAYITGRYGDCMVGKEYADMYNESVTSICFDERVIDQPDDHGCWRPCRLEETPGLVNIGGGKVVKEEEAKDIDIAYPAFYSVGILFEERPTQEMIDFMKKRAEEFLSLPFEDEWEKSRMPSKIAGFRLLETRTEVVEEKL